MIPRSLQPFRGEKRKHCPKHTLPQKNTRPAGNPKAASPWSVCCLCVTCQKCACIYVYISRRWPTTTDSRSGASGSFEEDTLGQERARAEEQRRRFKCTQSTRVGGAATAEHASQPHAPYNHDTLLHTLTHTRTLRLKEKKVFHHNTRNHTTDDTEGVEGSREMELQKEKGPPKEHSCRGSCAQQISHSASGTDAQTQMQRCQRTGRQHSQQGN